MKDVIATDRFCIECFVEASIGTSSSSKSMCVGYGNNVELRCRFSAAKLLQPIRKVHLVQKTRWFFEVWNKDQMAIRVLNQSIITSKMLCSLRSEVEEYSFPMQEFDLRS